jgi:double-stranded uracil-DNA glycosylase
MRRADHDGAVADGIPRRSGQGSRGRVLRPQSEHRSGDNGPQLRLPSNRFWRALHLAGFTPHRIAAADDRTLLRFGCGITAAVGRGTRSAAEVRRSEFAREAAAFERKVAHYRPHVIAFLGKAAYAAMSGRRSLEWGRQGETFGGATVWILPNPSGLNRAFSLDELVEHYGRLRTAVASELRRFERN